MRKIILLLLMAPLLGFSQICPTTIVYDNIETYTWLSAWSVGPNTGYYTNAFVSSNASAALIGGGSGTSAIESGYYVLPNVTGLNPSYNYILSFRLGSYRVSSTGATSGVDVPDYVDVQLSTNGGASYVSELRVTGNNNAYWTYASTAIASKTANGTLTTFTPSAGGDRTLTGDGYSNIQLTLPTGLSQCAFYIYCRVNSAGEEWWIDNIVLTEQTLCIPLPIELLEFTGHVESHDAILSWKTATETNNDYYELQRTTDGVDWIVSSTIPAAGNSNQTTHYRYIDYNLVNGTYYYRLKQVDYNGDYKVYNMISVLIDDNNTICDYTYYNLAGELIDIEKSLPGIYIRMCNGKYEKILKN